MRGKTATENSRAINSTTNLLAEQTNLLSLTKFTEKRFPSIWSASLKPIVDVFLLTQAFAILYPDIQIV